MQWCKSTGTGDARLVAKKFSCKLQEVLRFAGFVHPLLLAWKCEKSPMWSPQMKCPHWSQGSLKQKQKKSSHFRGHSTENILRVNSVSGPQVQRGAPSSLVANVRLWTADWEGCGEFTGLSGLSNGGWERSDPASLFCLQGEFYDIADRATQG